MKRTRAYRRDVRNKAVTRKKRISNEVYGFDWYKSDGYYSKGKIHCGCKLCKFGKHYNIPLLYEIKDKEYQKLMIEDYLVS